MEGGNARPRWQRGGEPLVQLHETRRIRSDRRKEQSPWRRDGAARVRDACAGVGGTERADLVQQVLKESLAGVTGRGRIGDGNEGRIGTGGWKRGDQREREQKRWRSLGSCFGGGGFRRAGSSRHPCAEHCFWPARMETQRDSVMSLISVTTLDATLCKSFCSGFRISNGSRESTNKVIICSSPTYPTSSVTRIVRDCIQRQRARA